MLGWSGETENNVWRKADVTLNEEDLYRLLREADVPEFMQTKLTTGVAHMLLDTEAEILLTTKLCSLGYPEETAAQRIDKLTQRKQIVLDELRKRAAGVPA